MKNTKKSYAEANAYVDGLMGRLGIRRTPATATQVVKSKKEKIREKIARVEMRKLSAIIAICLFALTVTSHGAYAQSEWERLNSESRSLSQQGDYRNAAAVAEKALDLAESAKGKPTPASPAKPKATPDSPKTTAPGSLKPSPKPATAPKPANAAKADKAAKKPAKPLSPEAEEKRKIKLAEAKLAKAKKQADGYSSIAISEHELGRLYQTNGRLADAEPLYFHSIQLFQKAAETKNRPIVKVSPPGALTTVGVAAQATPTISPEEKLIAEALCDLASLHSQLAKYAQAESEYERALAISEKEGKETPAVATTLTGLSEVYSRRGELEKAEKSAMRALAIKERIYGSESVAITGELSVLGGICKKREDFNQAYDFLSRGLAISEKAYGPDHPIVSSALVALAGVLYHQAQNGDALDMLQRALVIAEKAFGPFHTRVGVILNDSANIMRAMGQTDDARRDYLRANAISLRNYGPNHPELAVGLTNLAFLLEESDETREEAGNLFRQALAIDERVFGRENPVLLPRLKNLSGYLSTNGQIDENEAINTRIEKIEAQLNQ